MKLGPEDSNVEHRHAIRSIVKRSELPFQVLVQALVQPLAFFVTHAGFTGVCERKFGGSEPPEFHKLTKLGYTLIAFCVTASAVLLNLGSGFIPQ
jgi:hypothetical protein